MEVEAIRKFAEKNQVAKYLQGVPKRCTHSLNRYNLIKLLIFAFK